MPLLLLPYATTTQALSATTAQVIHGTEPYLTFDNGVTKVTTTDDLLGIKLSNGARFTPATNTSTAANPIQLPEANQSFADVGMLVPTNTNSIALSALIGAPYNYWGDDDGDGQGTNGVTATGNLTVSITDSNGQVVSRDTILNTCGTTVPPYKLVLTSTAGSLTTRYGLPNSSSFSGGTATYYISPKAGPTICYAKPNLTYGTGSTAGPTTIWNPDKGFLVQSTEPSSYNRNFPTTGANNLYFDLDISGINGSTLTWPTISQGGITATMRPSPDNANNIRVTLTGPNYSTNSGGEPNHVNSPSLPQTFVLVGYDSSYREVVRYGFVLKQWFINNGSNCNKYAHVVSWCSSLNSGIGYRVPELKELTNNASRDSYGNPAGTYQRNIGAGLFSEWGYMPSYTGSGFRKDFRGEAFYWTSNKRNSMDMWCANSTEGSTRADFRNTPDGSCELEVCATNIAR
ncbi:hypothetical protein A9G13_00670 [Gilliamella sp. wkB178]|uniref:hypothetical protein n=1 Tax=Gilliamella sp. wkB178 TaxID=3120259 RepID=UPI00080EB026|nr:hypothetical protein [Gilliamella apicola]OCG10286.1 hypothetical protein A9G13_00670 [Gilliamella apicola]